MTQIPKDRSFRECFIAPKDKVLIGIDADALELMLFGYYLEKFGNKDYIHSVALGSKSEGNDVHTKTQKLVGLPTRDKAKTFSYASLYGSGAFKLGRGLYTEGCVDDYTEEEYSKHKRLVESKIINNDFIRIDKSTVLKYDPKFILMSIYGERLRSRFLNGTEGFIDLMNYLTDQFNQQNQFIKSLDGRFVYCNSAHKSLNVLLQSSGAIFMKYYLLNVFYSLTKEGLKLNRDYANIANIHDALVLETYPQYRTIICDTLVKSFKEVSDRFNFSYPIKGYPIIHNNLYDIFVDEKEKRTYFKFDDY